MVVLRGWGFAKVLPVCFIGLQVHACFAQNKERCALAGTVVNSATNAGVAHALVSYFGPDSGYRFTDVGGNFRVENVTCQQYSLNVSKPGFVPPEDPASKLGTFFNPGIDTQDSESPEQANQPQPTNTFIDLKSGSPPTRIPLLPVSSITGVVLDENSEPLAGVSIQAIAVKANPAGAPDYVPGKTARTDDRGHYSLLNLQPGDYAVRLAGEVSSTRYFQGNALNPNNDHRGMQPVYYPDVDSLTSAQVLHLVPGEHANSDFHHPTEPAFDVNGRLTNFVAQAWTHIQVYREGDRIPIGAAYVNLSTGQFRVVDLPQGSYTLRAAQYQADPPQWLAAEEQVVVRSEPISDLAIQLSKGSDIPVSVSYEAGAQAGGQVQIMLEPQHSRENLRQVMIGAVGRRRLPKDASSGAAVSDAAPPAEETPAQPSVVSNVIPDRYKLTVQAMGNAGYVASAKLGDMDALHTEFPIGAGGGELHVTIRGDSATLEGKVTFNGQPAPAVQIYLVPAASGTSGPKFGFSDPEGHYQIAGVPPGDFKIRAWVGSPSAQELVSGSGETVTLQASEHRTMDLEAVQSSEGQKGGR